MTRSRWIVWLACIALLAQACATTRGGDAEVSEAERQAYASARASLPADPSGAAASLESFLQQWPQSGLADDAAELLAEIAAQQGDRETELRWLRYLVQNHGRSGRSDAARLRLARYDFEAGDLAEARRVLKPIRYSLLTPQQASAAYRLQAQLSEDPVDQLRWLARARGEQQDPEQLRSIDDEIDVLLSQLSDDQLEDAASALGREIPAGRVQLQRASRDLALGDFEAAEEALRRAERLPLSEADAQIFERLKLRLELGELAGDGVQLPTLAEAIERGMPSTQGATGAIGVLLPLSGPFQHYGEESLRGILLAARIFNEAGELPPDVAASSKKQLEGLRGEGADPSVPLAVALPRRAAKLDVLRIVVRDSRGNAKRAAEAVRELADEGVVAIIGPLLSQPAEAAAIAAEELEVPLLTLTTRQEVPRDRPYVFRLRTTPDDEVRFLVDYAIDKMKARRFAILHPDDGYGRGMRDRFWERLTLRGAGVVGVASYDPKSTDFATPIRRMIGYELLTRAEQDALQERESLLRRSRRLEPRVQAVVRRVAYALRGPEGVPLPPRVDFDVVFIPDSYDKVVLIAPQLAFHEVTGVRLMGPEGWNDPDLVKIARKHVRGAVISASFYEQSSFQTVASFVESYRNTYESDPESLAAQAFDAANLVEVQLAQGRDSRREVRDGVLRTEAYPGASGVMTLLPDGNARKRPFMLGVRRGKIVSLDD